MATRTHSPLKAFQRNIKEAHQLLEHILVHTSLYYTRYREKSYHQNVEKGSVAHKYTILLE